MSGPSKKSQRETTPSVLRNAIVQKLGQRIVATGELELPCIPGLLETYVARLVALWDLSGKPFSSEEVGNLRKVVETVLNEGYRRSPHAAMVVRYRTEAPPAPGLVYRVELTDRTMETIYADWLATREPPLFGAHPDAKVMAIASTLGPARDVAILDVGAGTGRNAIPLAKRGHPVTALEPVPALAAELRKAASHAAVSLDVVEGSVLAPELPFSPGRFQLAVLAEVVPHLRDEAELRAAASRMAEALQPGGLLLMNAFVALEGYKPDPVARQVSEIAWCRIFTRSELAFLSEELPFDRASDESVYDYEKQHLSAEAWPPTPWFEDWALGRNVFALPPGKAPIDLRWLVYRRRPHGQYDLSTHT